MSSINKYCEMEGLVEKTGLGGLVQVISLKSLNSLESENEILRYPDGREDRKIIEMNLDFPHVFSTVGETSRRFGRREGILDCEADGGKKDEGRNILMNGSGPIENLIKAVLNDDSQMIRKTLHVKQDLLSKFLLKFKKKACLSSLDSKIDKRFVEYEIFVDILQFSVLMKKPQALGEMLHFVKGDEMLQRKIRLNCDVENVVLSDFDYEDVQLEKQNIFHLAAVVSSECLKILLKKCTNSDILMSRDVRERTPFHIAAGNSSKACFEMLFNAVEEKDDIFLQDCNEYSPLHLATKFGVLETLFFILTNISNCQQLQIINTQNKKGKTPLFYAKDSKSIYLLLSYGADPTIGRCEGRSLLEEYIRVKPENARALLNYDVDTNGKEISDSKFLFTYDLRLFLAKALGKDEHKGEMEIISKFGEYRQKNMLNLPSPELFLQLKWQMIKKFYFLNWILYVTYLLSLTATVSWTSYKKNHQTKLNSSFPDQNSYTCNITTLSWYSDSINNGWKILHVFTFVFTCIILFREGMQLLSRKFKYLKSKENILELFSLIFAFTYLILISLTGKLICEWEQAAGSIALFLAWLEMSLMIGRLPSVGIYIYMSVNVIKQLLKFFSVYFTILMAFACAFNVILPKSPTFENLLTSFLKVIVMMIGEYDFESNFTMDNINQQGDSKGPMNAAYIRNVITQLLFISLVSVVSITIANLIIGLTVQNIAELQRNAGTYKLSKTIDQIKETEEVFIKNRRFMWLFQFIPAINKHMDLIPYLNSLVKHTRATSKNKSFFICVKPKDQSPGSGTAVSSMYFKVYMYDTEKSKPDKWLQTSIPEWVLANSKKALEEKSRVLRELDTAYECFAKTSSMTYNFSYAAENQRTISVSSLPRELSMLNEVPFQYDTDAIAEEIEKLENRAAELRGLLLYKF